MPAVNVLGVLVGDDGGPAQRAQTWAERLDGVKKAFGRLARINLSAFGRGLGSAAYGVSMLLHAAEYADAPTEAEIGELEKAVARLVDRGGAQHGFRGVRADLLAGRRQPTAFLARCPSCSTSAHATPGGARG